MWRVELVEADQVRVRLVMPGGLNDMLCSSIGYFCERAKACGGQCSVALPGVIEKEPDVRMQLQMSVGVSRIGWGRRFLLRLLGVVVI